jgi:hypothetical protein
MTHVPTLEEFSATAETAVSELHDRLVDRGSKSLVPNNLYVARPR